MLDYEIILYWSQETRAFIAEVTELPVVLLMDKPISQHWKM
ncbi:hypothetical protein [Dapis sp. BLCC M229]